MLIDMSFINFMEPTLKTWLIGSKRKDLRQPHSLQVRWKSRYWRLFCAFRQCRGVYFLREILKWSGICVMGKLGWVCYCCSSWWLRSEKLSPMWKNQLYVCNSKCVYTHVSEYYQNTCPEISWAIQVIRKLLKPNIEFSNNRYVEHITCYPVISTCKCANGQKNVEDCRSVLVYTCEHNCDFMEDSSMLLGSKKNEFRCNLSITCFINTLKQQRWIVCE